MIEVIPNNLKIDFVGKARFFVTLSAVLMIGSVTMALTRPGIKYGIDFAGGIEVQVRFTQATAIEAVREVAESVGVSPSVQSFGDENGREFLVRVPETPGREARDVAAEIIGKFQSAFADSGVEIRRQEVVGPLAGHELRRKGMLSLGYAVLAILIYIAFRFEWRFAIGAVVALAHDVIMTVGALVLTSREFNLTTIAALLTIIGYSINDTIVVYDRIRENRNRSKREDLGKVINLSINQTLSRTVLTAATVLMTMSVLFFATQKGSTVHDFAFTMIVGTIFGTYSSIYIASPILLLRRGIKST